MQILVDIENEILEHEGMLTQGYSLICLVSIEVVNALHSARNTIFLFEINSHFFSVVFFCFHQRKTRATEEEEEEKI